MIKVRVVDFPWSNHKAVILEMVGVIEGAEEKVVVHHLPKYALRYPTVCSAIQEV